MLNQSISGLRFPSRRSMVQGRRGAVATSQPLAAQAGLRILLAGGNAFDAAVATAATLNVVEPMSTGIGGDMFALCCVRGDSKVYALNGSGRAPLAANVEDYRRRFGARCRNSASTRSPFLAPVTAGRRCWRGSAR